LDKEEAAQANKQTEETTPSNQENASPKPENVADQAPTSADPSRVVAPLPSPDCKEEGNGKPAGSQLDERAETETHGSEASSATSQSLPATGTEDDDRRLAEMLQRQWNDEHNQHIVTLAREGGKRPDSEHEMHNMGSEWHPSTSIPRDRRVGRDFLGSTRDPGSRHPDFNESYDPDSEYSDRHGHDRKWEIVPYQNPHDDNQAPPPNTNGDSYHRGSSTPDILLSCLKCKRSMSNQEEYEIHILTDHMDCLDEFEPVLKNLK